MSNKKSRLLADNHESGQLRYRTYKAAIERISYSIQEGFYLEAITICESVIADRLESRLNFICNTANYSFSTLGRLIEGIRNKEKDNNIISFVNHNLDPWRRKRNNALHEMAKIEDGDSNEWADKIIQCESIAKEGEQIRKMLFKLMQNI